MDAATQVNYADQAALSIIGNSVQQVNIVGHSFGGAVATPGSACIAMLTPITMSVWKTRPWDHAAPLLHGVDAVGVVHAGIIRAQALLKRSHACAHAWLFNPIFINPPDDFSKFWLIEHILWLLCRSNDSDLTALLSAEEWETDVSF